MLIELVIQDFAIIDHLQLSFPEGFTALTGETGAGKSIIIDAVDLVLGGRADSTVVRAGADRSTIEATFRLDPTSQARIQPLLEQEELEGDAPDVLLLAREVRAEGRNVCRINGRLVTLSLLRQVTEGLVDIHGQSEHLSLLRVPEHVNLLDRYGDLWSLRERVGKLAAQVGTVRRERARLEQSEQDLARRMDLLRYQIDEIDSAALQSGEEEGLLEERVRLTNAEHLSGLAAEALQALSDGGEESLTAVDLVGAVLRALEGLGRIDAALETQVREAEEISYRLQDLAEFLRDYRERVEYNPRRLAEVEERLALIHRLERKYGAAVADVLAYAQRAVKELETITRSEERIAELYAEEERLLQELGAAAVELSRCRREAADSMARGIERELQDLRMEGARFAVDFQWREDEKGVPVEGTAAFKFQVPGLEEPDDLKPETVKPEIPARVAFNSTGIDHIEFLISPNPGEPLKPLARIASGGETSRLMLALKTVLSRADETPTLIFDEIDQGIGGRVGSTVGEKLWGLTASSLEGALTHQVLCITHLPQLAGFGDVHLKVDKHVVEGRTVTCVTALDGEARVDELAQMLGASGESVHRSAQELLEQVAVRKAQRAGARE